MQADLTQLTKTESIQKKRGITLFCVQLGYTMFHEPERE